MVGKKLSQNSALDQDHLNALSTLGQYQTRWTRHMFYTLLIL